MGAIDLLFDVNLASERLHQLVLATLLQETRVLDHFGVPGTPVKCEWESAGRLFDLAVKLDDGNIAWVEIKLDSVLSDGQRKAQLEHVLTDPGRACHHLIYLLLGACQHFEDATKLQADLTEKGGGHKGAIKLVTASMLKEILERADILRERSARARDVRDLVAAYVEALFKLDDRFHHFGEPSHAGWDAFDRIGFFARCKEKIPSMQAAGIGYVATPRGGFHGCWWGRKPVDAGATLYLQFEDDALRFKISFPESIKDRDRRSELWTAVHTRLLRAAEGATIQLMRPDRVRNGWTMTVAKVEPSPLASEKDWEQLTSVAGAIAEAERLLAATAVEQ